MSIMFIKSLCHEAIGGDKICPHAVLLIIKKTENLIKKGGDYEES